MYSTRTFVIPVLVFTIVYNVPKFFELTVEYIPVDYIEGLSEVILLLSVQQAFYRARHNEWQWTTVLLIEREME